MEEVTAEDKALREAQTTNPEAVLLTASGYSVVVRPPTGAEFNKYMSNAQSSSMDKKSRSIELLFRDCCVWPDRNAIRAMLEKKPGLALTFGEQALELSGAGVVVEKKA